MKIDETRFPGWLAELSPDISACRKCGKSIIWGKTRNGKSIPIDVPEEGEVSAEVYVSHFATCPHWDKE